MMGEVRGRDEIVVVVVGLTLWNDVVSTRLPIQWKICQIGVLGDGEG